MKALLLALALVSGCSFDTHRIPHQGWATSLVWGTAYGFEDSDEPPVIQWREQETLDCEFDQGHYIGFLIGDYYGAVSPDLCVAGVTWGDWWMIQIAHDTDDLKWNFSQSAFAHELWHAALWHRNLGAQRGDPGHLDPGFYPGGAVERANAMLQHVGL